MIVHLLFNDQFELKVHIKELCCGKKIRVFVDL